MLQARKIFVLAFTGTTEMLSEGCYGDQMME